MYHTYTTDAIVLESRPAGDASRLLWLFTKDLGLILADVKSARGHLSKLRPSIQTYAYGTFTLVRGKHGWRLINVIGRGNYYYELRHDKELLPVLARATHIMRRVIGLDDTHQDAFTVFCTGMNTICEVGNQSAHVSESLMMCRMLGLLGFLNGEELPEAIMKQYKDFSSETLASVAPLRRTLNMKINESLKHSGLI